MCICNLYITVTFTDTITMGQYLPFIIQLQKQLQVQVHNQLQEVQLHPNIMT